jgi:hypothetical protein
MSKGIVFSCFIVSIFITGCSTSNVVPMGSDLYMVSSSGAGFDTGGVRSNVYNAANKFCNKKGMPFKLVSYKSKNGKLASNPPSAELSFKCENVTDNTDLMLAEKERAQVDENLAPVKKDVYSELMKLNDLKEKGIISEKEFQIEKSKILNH